MSASVEARVRFGSVTIPFTVITRRRRDLSITVHPNLQITVVAPVGRPMQQIEAKVLAKAPWILRQQLKFRDLHPLPEPKRFVSGETHRYLGRQYRLRVIETGATSVRLDRPFLLVAVSDASKPEAIRKAIEEWYRARAETALRRQFEQLLQRHPSLRSLVQDFRVRHMERRWGSCSKRGTITLNPILIHASPACIEYVIAHELCHRRYMNHGPRFERLLTRVMPDWRARRRRLNATSM